MKFRTTAIKIAALGIMALFLGTAAQADDETRRSSGNGLKKGHLKQGLQTQQPQRLVRPVAGVPEPTGAAVFGLGAVLMVGASRLRRR